MTHAIMSCVLLAFALSLLFAQQDGVTSDWPNFLGPERTGKAELEGVDFDWGEDGPAILWSAEVGIGFGGVAVEGGEVFLLDREVGAADILRVFDLTTGEEKWRARYEAKGRLMYSGSRTTPAVSGDRVYTCGGFGQVTCFDRKAQSVAWSIDLAEEYGGELPMFGWSASPLVLGDAVIVTALAQDVGLVALDGKTGDELWTSQGVGTSHSTPAVLELLGEIQIVFLSTPDRGSGQDVAEPTTISSFDPATGDLLWQVETLLTGFPIPGPVQVDEGRFFVTGGWRAGSTMMSIQKTGDGYELEEDFHIDRGAQLHTPILHGEHLYLIANENWNDGRARRAEGGLVCLTLDGKELWRTKDAPFFGRGNVILAGDHLVIQDGFNGTLRAAHPTPDGYDQVAESNLFGIDDRIDHQMWAPMALAGKLLLLRSQDILLCVEL